jgi:hypothetical protein
LVPGDRGSPRAPVSGDGGPGPGRRAVGRAVGPDAAAAACDGESAAGAARVQRGRQNGGDRHGDRHHAVGSGRGRGP